MGSSKKHEDAELLAEKNRLLELENEKLHNRLKELTAELSELKGEKAPEQLSLELKNLEEQISSLRKSMFGDSSERRSQRLQVPKETTEPIVSRGRTPQDRLPYIETILELEEADRRCPACNGHLEEMGDQTEDTEVIDVVQRRFVVRKISRKKYRCKCQGAIVVAPPSPLHVPRGRYTLDFAAHVFVDKYGWSMPLDRQRRAMQSEGLKITSQTLWDQVNMVAGRLEPIYDALRDYILGADVIGVDETWWRLLNKKVNKRWWVWAMQAGEAVYFHTAPSRSADTALELLGDFEGTVICDAYKAYETAARKRGMFSLALCWSHARRKFFEAEPNYPVCGEALDLIGQLFALDDLTDDPTLLEGEAKLEAARARLAIRSERAPPILEALREWALAQRALPRSGLRKAIDYMLTHWAGLTRFVEDPYVPLDNNATERALRGVVLGRKNHYGSRSERGTQVAAIGYSLIESAKLAGLDPMGYIASSVHSLELGEDPRVLLPVRELWQDII